MMYTIWNFLPLFIKRYIKKFILHKSTKNLIINNRKIYDNFLLEDLLKKNIIIGKNCVFGQKDNSFFGKIQVGDYTYIGFPNNGIYGCNDFNITIGKYCSIARNLFIINYNYHGINKLSTSTSAFKNIQYKNMGGDILIGNDVWIGSNVTILPGITVGNGAVIGAGSIVTKDIPSYAIVGGNPAQIIKYRFDEPTREKLEKSEWWNWDREKIERNYALNFLNE